MAKASHYIDNTRFELVIKQYRSGDTLYEDEFISMFTLLINNILDSFGFKVDRDDATQECFLLILKTLKNFNKEDGTAFNYFTTIIVNNLKLIYTKNKRYNEKIMKYTEYITGQHPSSV